MWNALHLCWHAILLNTQIWVKFSHQMFLSIHFLIFKTNPRFCIYYEILLLLSLTSRLSLSASLPALKCCYQSYHKFTFGLFLHFFFNEIDDMFRFISDRNCLDLRCRAFICPSPAWSRSFTRNKYESFIVRWVGNLATW